MNNAETLAVYNAEFDKYVRNGINNVTGAMRDWLDRATAGLTYSSSILEIGSGTGRDADYLCNNGLYVYRTDASDAAVEYLQRQGRPAYRLNVLTDSMLNYIPMELIIANAVFLHFTEEEFKVAIQKCYDILAPDGRLAFTVKNGSSDSMVVSKEMSPRFFKYWSGADLIAQLYDVGFHDVEIVLEERWLHVVAEKDGA